MRGRISPKVFVAIYAFTVPLALGLLAAIPRQRSFLWARIREWQGLEAGILAIGAAMLGAYFVHRQTQESRRQNDERRSLKHAADRAGLTFDLDEMMEYATAVVTGLTGLSGPGSYREIRVPAPGYAPPEIDSEVLGTLRDLIESAPPKVGRGVSVLISDSQILSARLRSLAVNVMPGSHAFGLDGNAFDYTLNAAVICARAGAFFPYARNDTDEPPPLFPTVAVLTNALNILGFDEATTPDLYAAARVRAERHEQVAAPGG